MIISELSQAAKDILHEALRKAYNAGASETLRSLIEFVEVNPEISVGGLVGLMEELLAHCEAEEERKE